MNGQKAIPLSWPNASRLRLGFPVGEGAFVTIERVTPIDEALVKFSDGNVLTADDLNTAILQTLYRQQELAAMYQRSIGLAFTRLAGLGGDLMATEDLLDLVAQQMAADKLLDDFRARIADIDANGIEVLNLARDVVDQGTQIGGLEVVAEELRADLVQSTADLQATLDAILADDTVATLIQNETQERVDGDTALASTLALIGAKSGDGTAFIADLDKLRASPDETFAQRFSAISTQIGDTTAAITSEATARSTAVAAEAARIDGLLTRMGSAEAAVTSEAQARADGDAAEAAARNHLAATLRGETAAVVANEAHVRATADAAEATARNGLAATLRNEIGAAVQTETTARVNADGALAQKLNLLGATSADGYAYILDEDTVRVDGGARTLGSRLSGLDARMGNAEATIVQEQQVRASQDGAFAQQLHVLGTDVGNNRAAISTQQTLIDGVRARYGVVLNVNGHITGFAQHNDGAFGDFVVVADNFRIVAPNGGNPTTPFSVEAGLVRINGDLIVTGSINSGSVRLDTFVRRGSLGWAGTYTPAPGEARELAAVPLGSVEKDGSYRFDYEVRMNSNVGTKVSTHNGHPLTTANKSDGGVLLEVVDQFGNVLAAKHCTQNGPDRGQLVIDRAGTARPNCRFRAVAVRGSHDTGILWDGDSYYRERSADYTITFIEAKAKWTFI